MSVAKHTHKILKERGEDIRFIRAVEEDKPCWFYLKLHPDKIVEYEAKMESGDLDIRDYGEILESDWGSYPAEDVVGFMKDEYGFDTPEE